MQTNKQEEYSNVRQTDKQKETDRQVGTSSNKTKIQKRRGTVTDKQAGGGRQTNRQTSMGAYELTRKRPAVE